MRIHGSRFVVVAVFNGTKCKMSIPGNSIDKVMLRLRKDKTARNASAFLFFNRRTGNLVESRVN